MSIGGIVKGGGLFGGVGLLQFLTPFTGKHALKGLYIVFLDSPLEPLLPVLVHSGTEKPDRQFSQEGNHCHTP